MTVEGRFYHRVIKALDSTSVGPFLLWVPRWDNHAMPAAQRDKALQAVESWMVRRALCRTTAKDVNRVVVELLRAMSHAGPAAAGDAAEAFLTRQRAVPSRPERPEGLILIYDGGVLAAADVAAIRLQADELASCAFVDAERVPELTSALLARRIACLNAVDRVSLENGHPAG